MVNSTRTSSADASTTPPAEGTAPALLNAGAHGPVGLLEGTELVGEFKSSGYREASRLVARYDGRVVRLAPVLYAVVVALDRHARTGQRDAKALLSRIAHDVGDETGLGLTAEQVAYLLDTKLGPLGITTNSDGSRPEVPRSEAFLSLRLKKAVIPSSATWFLGGLFSWLFNPFIVVAVVAAAVSSEIWLFATQPMGSALARTLADPTSVLLVGVLAVASALFHEVGHATACRYSGVRPGAIGCGVYLVYPAFYTDITNSYRLERSGRLRTVLGGVYFNTVFILGLTLWYLWSGSPFLLAAVLIANLELIQQLLPTLRFDGYFIVSDLVGIPDLFKYIGPILKRTVLRKPPDERLRALKTWPQRVVTVWVLVVTPVLIAQLTFLAFQLPQFVRIGWQRITAIRGDATSPGTDVVGLVGDVALIMVALLPLAGLLVFAIQAGRGVANIVRNVTRDVGGPVGAAGDPGGGLYPGGFAVTGQVTPVPSSRHPRVLAVQEFLFVFIASLLVANAAFFLSGGGSSDDGLTALEAGGRRVPAEAGIPGLVTFDDLSRRHVSSAVDYAQTPPVGGDHAPMPQACRVYSEPVRNELAVHSMEHGAVWLTYRPGLEPSQIDRLRREARRSHVLVSPYPGLTAPVVASAWGQQLRLETAYDGRLDEFVSRFRQGPQTPERGAAC